ncbi:hypothetical protein ACFO5R_12215 [Halosolutus amylolyticus]|uniref:Peptidase S54 rhomboid domain-containing protein n=1 Tax=Halosolutus amylolyticus TaxID=2932267 RepID=A0ABD5PRX2_9EURY|nr:hypothetical protein [Halosolutus amylolyticus]
MHIEPAHLVANLIGYGLLAGTCYLLAVESDHRSFFVIAFSGIVLSFPLTLSALNLATPRNGILYGFSGVNMALLGLLPLCLVEFARVRFWIGFERRDGGMLFFLSLAAIAMLAVPLSLMTSALSLSAVVISGWYVHDLTDRGFRLAGFLRLVLERRHDGNQFVLGSVLFVSYLFVGFPTDIVTDGSVLNLYVHFLGYSMGFVGSYVLLEAQVFGPPAPAEARDSQLETRSR